MKTSLIQLPDQLNYPVQIEQTHVVPGQKIARGERLYTLKDASGSASLMKSPRAGRIIEGPVPEGAVFDRPMPILGIEALADGTNPGAPETSGPDTPKAQPSTAHAPQTATDQFSFANTWQSLGAMPGFSVSDSAPDTDGKAARQKQATPETPAQATPVASPPPPREMPTDTPRADVRTEATRTEPPVPKPASAAPKPQERAKPATPPTTASRPIPTGHPASHAPKTTGPATAAPPVSKMRIIAMIFVLAAGPAAYLAMRAIGADPVAMPDRDAAIAFGTVIAGMAFALFLVASKQVGVLKTALISTGLSAAVLFPINFVPLAVLPDLPGISTGPQAGAPRTIIDGIGPENPSVALPRLRSLAALRVPRATGAEQNRFDEFLEAISR